VPAARAAAIANIFNLAGIATSAKYAKKTAERRYRGINAVREIAFRA
jgi:hypothetical protein